MSHQHDVDILTALEAGSPHAAAFRNLSRRHWNNGALSSRDKHLLAVAAAQVTRCTYCIEHHAQIARQLGATRNEVLAAAYITAALETLLNDAIDIGADGAIAVRASALEGLPVENDRDRFVNTLLGEPTLPLPLRYVIAAAVGLAKEREGLRLAFHQAALRAGTSPQALEEGYAVALIIRAGAVYAHTLGIARAFA
ncbi:MULTISPECIES: carboxymuconolactone decarboxylase family protein [unclassified Brenneria]|uniref:carboxymuconolactone decarboxylase family protein n=1 Tax=unclassified Brenneria TaxID=2634434 RepID=UPI0029C36AAD|nr:MULTISPECIES: carboxymuconolactone decarboxylase family protein [unclassified Brenneria]MDX5627544.1 carboxymuconolactone decarboxylase family protein [Brenneria sp. L3-3Z]MDX5694300.1 carboxymuconolactone decarboxylase family protein [Brenneria sp. L4-2C]MEE3662117.1 carboxymuconolactone decarboxylase family protein [Brenneria sp. g21c3]